MTEQELAAVVQGIAPVIREAVAHGVKDVGARLAVVEARPVVPGPAGPQGEKGDCGLSIVGPVGPAGTVPEALETRIVALNAKVDAMPTAPADMAPEEFAASLSGLLLKELAVPLRTQKRIVKDGAGYTVTEEQV